MSKKLFTEKEIKILSKNKNILKVSSKSIVYALEFKEKFIEEYSKGKSLRIIFEENGFNTEIIGIKRVNSPRKDGINQSMSRRGNCWDNVPMESFFGHKKERNIN